MANSRTKNTLLNTLGGVILKFVSMILAFVTRTIFLKTLGIQYAGVSDVFTSILMVLSFAEMGIGSAIVFALYKPIAENDHKQISKLINFYRKTYMVVVAVIMLLGIGVIPFLNYLIKDVPNIVEDIRVIYILYLVNTASSYIMVYKSTFLTAAQKDYLVSKIRIIITVIKTVGESLLLLIFKNFILYLIFGSFMTLLQNVVVARVAEREYPILKEKSTAKLDKSEKKRLFDDVKALFIYKVCGSLLNGSDNIIISSFINTTQVGIFGNYNLITKQLYGFNTQFFHATGASIGNLSATSTPEHQHRVFEKMMFITFCISSLCSVCLWTLFNPFMTFWQGEIYTFSPVIVALLVIDFYTNNMSSPIHQFRTSNGLFKQGKYRPVIMVAINIIVSVILVKRIGITGVIIGTVFSRAVTLFWYDPYLIHKMVFKKPVRRYFYKYILYGLVTFVGSAISSWLLSALNIQNLLLNVFAGAVIAVTVSVTLICVCFYRTDEFKQTLQLAKNIISRKI